MRNFDELLNCVKEEILVTEMGNVETSYLTLHYVRLLIEQAQIDALEWASEKALTLGSKLENEAYQQIRAKITELKG